jgi:uncharacterized membrane protein
MKLRLIFIVMVVSGLLVGGVFITNSCTHEPELISEFDTICFENQILPVIQGNCIKCHGGGSGEGEGFDASDYTSIMRSVTAGNAQKSKLYQVITKIYGESAMPPDAPLSKQNRSLIMVWIEQGANDYNPCNNVDSPQPVDTSQSNINYDSLCFEQDIFPIFISKCNMCHNGEPYTNSEGETESLDKLTSYNDIKAMGVNKIISYVKKSSGDEDRMPPPNQVPPPPFTAPIPPLTADEIALLEKWNSQGAIYCDYPQKSCDTLGTISYSAKIDGIFNLCSACHSASNHQGGIDLSTPQLRVHYSTTIKPGTSESYVVGSINWSNGFSKMPLSAAKLDNCSIRSIELWIEQGCKTDN